MPCLPCCRHLEYVRGTLPGRERPDTRFMGRECFLAGILGHFLTRQCLLKLQVLARNRKCLLEIRKAGEQNSVANVTYRQATDC